jgi:hypothetical protein
MFGTSRRQDGVKWRELSMQSATALGSRIFIPVWAFAAFDKTISNAGQASRSGLCFVLRGVT